MLIPEKRRADALAIQSALERAEVILSNLVGDSPIFWTLRSDAREALPEIRSAIALIRCERAKAIDHVKDHDDA